MERSHIETINFKIPEKLTKFEDYPKITNYVSIVNLGIKLDLNIIASIRPDTDRKPRRFAAITLRVNPTTVLLFSTGTMIVGGAKTENQSLVAAHGYRLFLEKIPQPLYDKDKKKFFYSTWEKYSKFNRFEVINVVGSGRLFNIHNNEDEHQNQTVDLYSLAKNNLINAGWDKETFSGLIFDINSSPECPLNVSSIMAHVFQKNANDVLMGAKTEQDIYIGHNHLKTIVSSYIKPGDTENNIFVMESVLKEKFINNKRKIPQKEKRPKKKARVEVSKNDEDFELKYQKFIDNLYNDVAMKIVDENKDEDNADNDDNFGFKLDNEFLLF